MSNLQNSNPTNMNPFPKKDQAIILSVDDNLKLGDYVTSISEIVEPKNITFASRISNNRVCIYLSSSQLAESLARQHKTIVIKGIDISIRRLITPSKRIILSSVCPSIPHNMLEQLIRQIANWFAATLHCFLPSSWHPRRTICPYSELQKTDLRRRQQRHRATELHGNNI
jgi:hypothetical protein